VKDCWGPRIGGFWESMPLASGAQRSSTHEVSPTWLPKHDLNKKDTDGHAMEVRELTRLQPKQRTTGNQKNAENWRNSLPQGRVHQLAIQYQIVSPENRHCTVTVYSRAPCIYRFKNPPPHTHALTHIDHHYHYHYHHHEQEQTREKRPSI